MICDETYEVGKSAHETIRTKSMVTLYSFASTLRFAIDQFKASSKPTKEVLLILRHFTQACTSVKASIIDCILDGLERWASVSGAPSVAKAGRSLGKSPTSISILKRRINSTKNRSRVLASEDITRSTVCLEYAFATMMHAFKMDKETLSERSSEHLFRRWSPLIEIVSSYAFSLDIRIFAAANGLLEFWAKEFCTDWRFNGLLTSEFFNDMNHAISARRKIDDVIDNFSQIYSDNFSDDRAYILSPENVQMLANKDVTKKVIS